MYRYCVRAHGKKISREHFRIRSVLVVLRLTIIKTNYVEGAFAKQRQSEVAIDVLGEDPLYDIFSRLPAVACAAAACVCRSWNLIITRLLSLPILSSALSRNPSLQGAVDEVVDKVLARPIRPQFVLVSSSFGTEEAHRLIRLPNSSNFFDTPWNFWADVTTNEFEEVMWGAPVDVKPPADQINGFLLTVGSLPGLTVDLIALPKKQTIQDTNELLIDQFVLRIRECSSSRSGSASPMGILLLFDMDTDIKPVLEKLDYAFPTETVIVGDGDSEFYYGGETATNPSNNKPPDPAAVALVFARDRGKPPGVGETKFHVMLSTGMSPIGPTYKAVSVREIHKYNSTWLTAKREAVRKNLNGQTILDQIYYELGGHIHRPELYIGVTKRRKCSIGQEKPGWINFHEFHEVSSGAEYLDVHGMDISSGDSFRFYHANSDIARASCKNVSNNFRQLKQDLNYKSDGHTSSNGVDILKKSVFGGIMFPFCGRGKLMFGEPNVDGLPFLENFPGVTFSGTYCFGGEIARCDLSSYEQGSQEHSSAHCRLHVNSTVYLVMSYAPAPPQH